MTAVSLHPRIKESVPLPHGITYREYLIAQIAAGAIQAKYLNGAMAELLAPQVISIADQIIKELEKQNA